MNGTRQINSYVFHDGKCFTVSTIERDSDIAECPGRRHMETIVWNYNWDTRERGTLVRIDGARVGIKRHLEICEELHRTGKIEDEE